MKILTKYEALCFEQNGLPATESILSWRSLEVLRGFQDCGRPKQDLDRPDQLSCPVNSFLG